jgi:hypothetical protein
MSGRNLMLSPPRLMIATNLTGNSTQEVQIPADVKSGKDFVSI